MSTDLSEMAPELVGILRHLGDEYGPTGVALAAAQLTDLDYLIRELIRERERPRLIAHMENLDSFIREADEREYVPLADVISVIQGHATKGRRP